MDPKMQQFSWKRLVVTVLLVVIASSVTSGITWFILDRTFNDSQQANASLIATLEKKITYLDTKLGSTATEDKNLTKKYVNSKFGFSFDYPSTWTVAESINGNEGTVTITTATGKNVYLWINLGGRGFESVKYTVNYDVTISDKKLVLSNRKLTQTDSLAGESGSTPTLGYMILAKQVISGANNYTFVSYDTSSNVYTDSEKAFNDIISTFSFS